MKKFAILAAIAAVLGVATPAGAQSQEEVNVLVIEGIGLVCSGVPGGSCAYDLDDALWSGQTNNPPAQGFYAPGVGPGATRSPTLFAAGPNTQPPTSVCVSTIGGPGCTTVSGATQAESEAGTYGVFVSSIGVGAGAYCGSSSGHLKATFDSSTELGLASVHRDYIYGWEQSLATVLPIVGSSADGSETFVGFFSARGLQGSGNCGANQATTGFQVEGFAVTTAN